MGVIESMALMPVCSGSCTGLRAVIPGAWTSSRRVVEALTGPLPSMGTPRLLTTRPRSSSPTGTDRMRPVAFTVWPSSTCSPPPRMTAPIDSSSRLRESPSDPSSNSSSSFTAASGRPATLAMPSPTSRTRPTWAIDTSALNPSRFLRRLAVTSSALMVSSAMGSSLPLPLPRPLDVRLPGSERALELLEAGLDRPIDHDVANRGDHAAHHGGIDDHLDLDRLPRGPLQRIGQPRPLLVVEIDGRAHLGHLALGLGRTHPHELVDDRRQVAAATGADGHRNEGDGGGVGLRAEEVLDDLLAPAHRDAGIGERVAQLVVRLEGPGEPEQLVLDIR